MAAVGCSRTDLTELLATLVQRALFKQIFVRTLQNHAIKMVSEVQRQLDYSYTSSSTESHQNWRSSCRSNSTIACKRVQNQIWSVIISANNRSLHFDNRASQFMLKIAWVERHLMYQTVRQTVLRSVQQKNSGTCANRMQIQVREPFDNWQRMNWDNNKLIWVEKDLFFGRMIEIS